MCIHSSRAKPWFPPVSPTGFQRDIIFLVSDSRARVTNMFQIPHSPGKITEPVKSPCSSVSPSRGADPNKITSPSFLSLQPRLCVHAQVCLTLWTVAHQDLLSMGFSRQEYWSGLPYLSPGDLLDPGIKPASLTLAGEFFTAEPPEKPALVVEETFCWSKLFSVRIAPCVVVFLMCLSKELSSVSS